jgi:hypothetical protein
VKAGFASRLSRFLEPFEDFFSAAFAHGGGVQRGDLRGREVVGEAARVRLVEAPRKGLAQLLQQSLFEGFA